MTPKPGHQLITNAAEEIAQVYANESLTPKEIKFQVEAILGSYGLECGFGAVLATVSGADCPESFRNSIKPALAQCLTLKAEFDKLKVSNVNRGD